jgi:uridine kinase
MNLNLSPDKVTIVAIDGYGGSGKSTLAKQMQANIPNTKIISLDEFRTQDVYEVDRIRLVKEVLQPLSANKVAAYRSWLWNENKFSAEINIEPVGLVIIEGTTALHPELRQYYDYKIWIDMSQQIAFARGLARDKKEYGVDSLNDWTNKWMPYEKNYVETTKPYLVADFNYTEP